MTTSVRGDSTSSGYYGELYGKYDQHTIDDHENTPTTYPRDSTGSRAPTTTTIAQGSEWAEGFWDAGIT